jgi:hypothetical protein
MVVPQYTSSLAVVVLWSHPEYSFLETRQVDPGLPAL